MKIQSGRIRQVGPHGDNRPLGFYGVGALGDCVTGPDGVTQICSNSTCDPSSDPSSCFPGWNDIPVGGTNAGSSATVTTTAIPATYSSSFLNSISSMFGIPTQQQQQQKQSSGISGGVILAIAGIFGLVLVMSGGRR